MTGRLRVVKLLLTAALCLPAEGIAIAQETGQLLTAKAGLSTPSLNPLADVTPEQAVDFLGRPLFSASRRPYVAPPAAAAAPPVAPEAPSASHIRLVGTVRMPSGSTALVEDTTRGVMHTISEGGMVDGWRVSDIWADGVRIEQDGRTIELGIFKPGQQPAPAPSVAQQTATGGTSNAQRTTPMPQAPTAPPVAAGRSAPGAAPPGTVAGTAAAEAAANSPYKLIFGTAVPADKP